MRQKGRKKEEKEDLKEIARKSVLSVRDKYREKVRLTEL